MSKVFISYRRDDAAGYAGRLEEALERRLGRDSVFRDVTDIPPGGDFMAAIRARLAQADAVLVLIGPRWAGGEADGRRRIDDPQDFVRLEVALALESGVRVVPVLLPGIGMPTEAALPDGLKPLARRNAVTLSDTNWGTDVDRLASTIGVPKRARWKWAVAGAAVAVGLVCGALLLRPAAPPSAAERLVGVWKGTVRYDWGDSYEESFEFKHHAGELTGTASFLKYPHAIEALRVGGMNLHFEIHSIETMGDSTKEVTRSYTAELRGGPPNEVLAFRMLTSGSHSSHKPVEFEARRIDATSSGRP